MTATETAESVSQELVFANAPPLCLRLGQSTSMSTRSVCTSMRDASPGLALNSDTRRVWFQCCGAPGRSGAE